jgi:hypothetical protein
MAAAVAAVRAPHICTTRQAAAHTTARRAATLDQIPTGTPQATHVARPGATEDLVRAGTRATSDVAAQTLGTVDRPGATVAIAPDFAMLTGRTGAALGTRQPANTIGAVVGANLGTARALIPAEDVRRDHRVPANSDRRRVRPGILDPSVGVEVLLGEADQATRAERNHQQNHVA